MTRRVTYNDALKECLQQPAIKDCRMTPEEIQAAIAGISAQLRGPLPNVERLILVAERQELRVTLKELSHT